MLDISRYLPGERWRRRTRRQSRTALWSPARKRGCRGDWCPEDLKISRYLNIFRYYLQIVDIQIFMKTCVAVNIVKCCRERGWEHGSWEDPGDVVTYPSLLSLSLLTNTATWIKQCKANSVSLLLNGALFRPIWFLILELGSGEDGWGLSRYLLTPSITWYPPGHRTSPRASGRRTRSACASSHGTRGCGCWCRAGARTCTRQNPRSSWTLQNRIV